MIKLFQLTMQCHCGGNHMAPILAVVLEQGFEFEAMGCCFDFFHPPMTW
ncbi:Uncharacterised protein [Yersinia enterocolitica]|uniref:Uncharacterized protein n=1 Tax=Yersinia enterocolitica TaxID=630 RepID=A0A0H5EUV9_YEREN|nr:Uncharacterised protein [Yersinia enterocolitica]VEB01135.1 Uncharacterised protein [Yersinia enterocolitica subsp. enterocolitica]VEF83961.1 Uncharacterised protein [Yersinia enterocolitica subsp. palearctica]CFQ74040.1 Uncharacterised protein [Yersinia enterocolitica]CFV22851.1 Uncharacterised protein [Yersinia enterocolitica]